MLFLFREPLQGVLLLDDLLLHLLTLRPPLLDLSQEGHLLLLYVFPFRLLFRALRL